MSTLSGFAAPSSSSAAATTAPAAPQMWAIHALQLLQSSTTPHVLNVQPPSTSALSSKSLPPQLRAIDALKLLKSIHNAPLQPPSLAPSKSILHPIAKLLCRAHQSQPVNADSKTSEPKSAPVVIELTDSDSDDVEPESESPQYVFNTSDLLVTQQMIRTWHGDEDPSVWVLSGRISFHPSCAQQKTARIGRLPILCMLLSSVQFSFI